MKFFENISAIVFDAGFQTMLGGDIRISAPDAQFSIMKARRRLVRDVARSALIQRLVRTDVARKLSYSARRFDGLEAEKLGLVTRTTDDDFADAMARARRIVARPPETITAAKRLHNLAERRDGAKILEQESVEQTALLCSDAHRALLNDALSPTTMSREA